MNDLKFSIEKYFVRVAALGILVFCFQVSVSQPITILPKLPAYDKLQEFTITENDSTIYKVKLAYDRAGLPLFFFRNVFTPVCYTGVCKPVYIDLYWDLLGNYLGFEVPAHEPLTKTDHKEFEHEDYLHLHKILANTQSLLQDFNIYELVDTRTYNLSDSVDAVTGATPKTIKNEVIGGAVYTCFTLWHIVNGPVVEALAEITESHCNHDLLKGFLRSGNHHYQYWAMDKTLADNKTAATEFLPDILQIVQGRNIFTARYALDKIPAEIFTSSDTLQTWIWSVYKRSNYTLQSAILEKLREVTLSDKLLVSLSGELKNTNEEQFSRILELLAQQDKLSLTVVGDLGEYLDHSDAHRAAAVYHVLSKVRITDGSVRKKMKRLERSNPHLR